MKRIIILILLLSIPIVAKANIVCNDGTESPTCLDCHTGCCSGHKGCANNPNYNYHKNKNITQKKNSNGLSKMEYIFLLIFLIPWVIVILITLFDFLKECVEKIINKLKKGK